VPNRRAGEVFEPGIFKSGGQDLAFGVVGPQDTGILERTAARVAVDLPTGAGLLIDHQATATLFNRAGRRRHPRRTGANDGKIKALVFHAVHAFEIDRAPV